MLMGGVQLGWEGQRIEEMGVKPIRGMTTIQTFSNLFLNILTAGAVTTEAGSLFQYFTTLTEKADPLLRQWLVPKAR